MRVSTTDRPLRTWLAAVRLNDELLCEVAKQCCTQFVQRCSARRLEKLLHCVECDSSKRTSAAGGEAKRSKQWQQ